MCAPSNKGKQNQKPNKNLIFHFLIFQHLCSKDDIYSHVKVNIWGTEIRWVWNVGYAACVNVWTATKPLTLHVYSKLLLSLL